MKNNYNIAIDVSPLQDGNSIRGVGYYTQHLVESLKNEIKTNSEYKNWNIDLITDKKNFDEKKYDLVHYPYFDPFFLTLPKKNKTKRIVTVHDLIPIQYKTHFPVGIKGLIKWFIQKKNVKNSDLIITISHSSKYDISDILKYPTDKIYVTYLAADKNFKPITDKEKLKLVKDKYSLPDKFILYVGDINWNKNIPTLVKACQKINIPLVLVGSVFEKSVIEDHPWNKDLIWLKQQKFKNIITTGFIPDQDLNIIYNLAFAYCQPSFAEGFGLPLVQAMKANCPVIYSHKTSLPEVMNENPIFFNPDSINDLILAIQSLEKNDKLRENIIKLNKDRSDFFDWSLTAKQTLAVYSVALND